MAWLVSALGIALALAGAFALVSGSPYIQLEWGWTEVIAGTTALSAGVVTLALGAVLFSLNRLRRALGVAAVSLQEGGGQLGVPMPVRAEPEIGRTAAPDALPQPALVGDATPAVPSLDDTAVRTAARDQALAMGQGRDERSLAIAVPPRDADDRFADHRPTIDPESPLNVVQRSIGGAPAEPARSTPSVFRSTEVREPEPGPSHTDGPAGLPTVVGRYEAGGASYVLFSDGTIDVETEGGTHRFGSMQELRDHIGQQDEVG